MHERFRHFAERTCAILGSVWAFTAAVFFVSTWLITGPIFRFSDTWQLTLNTVASVVAVLMVFVIQNTQNRDARAFHLKLDELIRSVEGARTGLVQLEDLSDNELRELREQFRRLHDRIYKVEDVDGDPPPT